MTIKSYPIKILRLFGCLPLQINKEEFKVSSSWSMWSNVLMILIIVAFIERIYLYATTEVHTFVGGIVYIKLIQLDPTFNFVVMLVIIWTNLSQKNLQQHTKFLNFVMKFVSTHGLTNTYWQFTLFALTPLIIIVLCIIIFYFIIGYGSSNTLKDVFCSIILTSIFQIERMKVAFFCKLIKDEVILLDENLRNYGALPLMFKKILIQHEKLLKSFNLFKKVYGTYTHFYLLSVFIDVAIALNAFQSFFLMCSTGSGNAYDLINVFIYAIWYVYKMPIVLYAIHAGEAIEKGVSLEKNEQKFFFKIF